MFRKIRIEEKEEEVITCLNLANGKILWQQSYPAPYTPSRAAGRHGKGPKSTPALHNDRLITLGISGILSCYDTKNGKLNWRKDFSEEFPANYPLYGVAMSPLIHNEKVIVHVGEHDRGAMIAYNIETGKTEWRWDEDGPAYTSPIVAQFDGTEQIITQTQNFCLGISPETGKLLWSIPFTTQYDQNIVTPLLFKKVVIYSGLRKGATARIIKKQA